MKKLILIISLLILTSCTSKVQETQPSPQPSPLEEREGKENSLKEENTGSIVGNREVKEENKTCILGNEIYGKWSDLEENRYFMSGGFIRFNEIDNNGFKLKGDLLSTLICKGDESFLKTTELKSIESKVSKESKKLFGKDFYTYWINKSGDYNYLLGYGLDSLEKGGFKSVTNDDFWKNNNSENVFLVIINGEKINIIDLGKLNTLNISEDYRLDILDINIDDFFSLNNFKIGDNQITLSSKQYFIIITKDYFIINKCEYLCLQKAFNYNFKEIDINKLNNDKIIKIGNIEFKMVDNKEYIENHLGNFYDLEQSNSIDTLYYSYKKQFSQYPGIEFIYQIGFYEKKNGSLLGTFPPGGLGSIGYKIIKLDDFENYNLEKIEDNMYLVEDEVLTKKILEYIGVDIVRLDKNNEADWSNVVYNHNKPNEKAYKEKIFKLFYTGKDNNYVIILNNGYSIVALDGC